MKTTAHDTTQSSSAMSGNHDGSLDKASSMAHAAVDSIADTAEDAARKAKPAIHQAAAVAHKTVDRAAGAAAPTADWLVAKGASLNAAQKRVIAGTSSYVSENPFKSIGIAVLAGFLLSSLNRTVRK